jgi:hypothetical protein
MNAEQLTVLTFPQPALREAKGSNVSSFHPSCFHKPFAWRKAKAHPPLPPYKIVSSNRQTRS